MNLVFEVTIKQLVILMELLLIHMVQAWDMREEALQILDY